MHVLYFHQHFSTPNGSTGIRSYEMAKKLIALGHKVTMVCGSYGGGKTGVDIEFVDGVRRGIVDGINVVEFELEYSNEQALLKRTMTFTKFALRSAKLALTEDYDLIFATTTPLTAAIPGIAARWLRGKKFVFEVRDLWPELPREMGVIKNPIILAAMGGLEWLAYKSAHGLIGLSPGIKKGIERLNIAPEKVVMIPNGCDLNIFNQKLQPWQPEGVNDTDLMAVFTGTHGIANGLESVIDAAKILQEREIKNVKIVLIGQGKLKAKLQGIAHSYQLSNVLFLDPVNKAELANLMARADIGLQILANIPAFYYGTSPNKFFDYISSSLPVLNNYPGWVTDMIIENDCGFAVEPENPESFADALMKASNIDLTPLGENSLKLAKSNFDRNKLSDQFVNFLEDVKNETIN
jgi:glycosyltransferase involved in cell wall biosynthesis